MAKNRYGMARLYRIRYLHRGAHPVRSAKQPCRLK
jgi:hypothetical protein